MSTQAKQTKLPTFLTRNKISQTCSSVASISVSRVYLYGHNTFFCGLLFRLAFNFAVNLVLRLKNETKEPVHPHWATTGNYKK